MAQIKTSRTCPDCQNDLWFNDSWLPGSGFDPRMRQYYCFVCRIEWYIIKGSRLPKPCNQKFDEKQLQPMV